MAGLDEFVPEPDARHITPSASAALEKFRGSSLLAEGQINLLALDAIAERLGPKWAMRRDAVYDYAERTLEKHIGEGGLYLRVSERDFLVILPSEGKYAAQARCIHYLREILTYFLGSAQMSDIAVRQVTSISNEGLEAVLIDPTTADVAADNERKKEQSQAQPPAAGTVDRWTPFVASNGKRVRVSCVLEPVFELKNYTRIGNRIARRVLNMDTEEPLSADETLRLSRSDIERIDLATIARGLQRLANETGDQLSLIVPASYVSLSNRQGRTALAQSFGEARGFVKTGVICEVRDIEGVPQRTLVEATSLIKPYCMFMVGGLRMVPERNAGNLRDAGLQAVSFEAPEAIVSDTEFSVWAKEAISAAKLIAKSVIVYRLNSARHAAIAALLGATHASLRIEAKSAG